MSLGDFRLLLLCFRKAIFFLKNACTSFTPFFPFFFLFFSSSVVIHRLYSWKRPIKSPSTPCQHRTVLQQTFVMVLFILVSHAPNNKVSATSPGPAASQVHITNLQEGFSSFSSAPLFPLHVCCVCCQRGP